VVVAVLVINAILRKLAVPVDLVAAGKAVITPRVLLTKEKTVLPILAVAEVAEPITDQPCKLAEQAAPASSS
jgi:hypothetical protein